MSAAAGAGPSSVKPDSAPDAPAAPATTRVRYACENRVEQVFFCVMFLNPDAMERQAVRIIRRHKRVKPTHVRLMQEKGGEWQILYRLP